jgi:hypothetical protein
MQFNQRQRLDLQVLERVEEIDDSGPKPIWVEPRRQRTFDDRLHVLARRGFVQIELNTDYPSFNVAHPDGDRWARNTQPKFITFGLTEAGRHALAELRTLQHSDETSRTVRRRSMIVVQLLAWLASVVLAVIAGRWIN